MKKELDKDWNKKIQELTGKEKLKVDIIKKTAYANSIPA